MSILKGRVEQYADDQIIVALPDLGEVRRVLGEFGLEPGSETTDQRLGLALLELTRLEQGMRRIRQDAAGADLVRAATAAWQADVDVGMRPSEVPDLDLLLLFLRGYFRERFSGWVPTMGKNNVVSHPGLAGFPHLRGGGPDQPAVLPVDPHLRGGGPDQPAVLPVDPHLRGGGPDQPPVLPVDPHLRGGGPDQPAGEPTVPWRRREARPGAGVRVGLLDTRLSAHPWLAGAYTAALDALIEPGSGDTLQPATAGHATFVAGLILCRAPGAVLEVRAVLDAQSLGSVWDAARHIAELTGSGLDVLNLSFGCFTDDGQPPLALATAIGLMRPQTVVVAAAGNYDQVDLTDGLTRTTPMWPAALDEVIAVGAADGNGEFASFSPDLPWIDFLAPGVDVESTFLTGRVRIGSPEGEGRHAEEALEEFDGWAQWSGTSFAAASVSGAIAARIEPGHRTASEALDMLRKPRQSGPDSDIRPLS
jgi:membrane-anchored mycosin MYCP